MRRKTLLSLLLYAVCGALLALPMIVPAMAPLSWIAAAPVYCLEYLRSGENRRGQLPRAYGRGFAFLYAYGLVTFWWFIELYPLDFVGLGTGGSIAVICAGWFGLPLLQSTVGAFQFLLLNLSLRVFRLREHRALVPPVAAALWCLFEWIQTTTWAGVPWGKLAMGQAGLLPLIQSVSLLGPYLIALLVIGSCAAMGMAALAFRERGWRAAVPYAAVVAVLFSGNLSYGIVRIAVRNGQAASRTAVVAAVQGNISSKDKWDTGKYAETVSRYESLTRAAAADGASLIVWPETALPYELTSYPALLDDISSLSRETASWLFVGALHRDAEENLLNVLFLSDPDGVLSETRYVKRHLVPFGEYVPWRPLFEAVFPPLSEISAVEDDLLAGTEPALFETAAGEVGALICFDSIYESLARDSVRAGADLLILATNDSWFGESSAIYEHNRHAILRAVENGRYLVRAANTGVSTILSDTGEILAQLDPMKTGYITAEVELLKTETLYTRTGDVILVVLAGGMLGILAFCRFSRGKEREA